MANLLDRGSYMDCIVTVPANTIFKEGLVLGCSTTANKLIPFGTKDVTQTQTETGSITQTATYAENPEYVLIGNLINNTDKAVDMFGKVLCIGKVNAYALTFAKESDTIDSVGFLTKLKNNGILAKKIESHVEL